MNTVIPGIRRPFWEGADRGRHGQVGGNDSPMPENASRALKLVDDPGFHPFQIAAILAGDPALVSALLRAANSASLGRAEMVSAPRRSRSGRRLWFAKNPAVGLHT